MMQYFRPLLSSDLSRPTGAVPFGDTPYWFDRVEVLERQSIPKIISIRDVPQTMLHRLSSVRAPIAGVRFDRPSIMGILNVTPDSFSDGGQHNTIDRAIAHAHDMVAMGANIIDIGGESTRPGADTVETADEIARTQPVIAALVDKLPVPLSLDTRKSAVARAGIAAGVHIINDVSGLTYDHELLQLCVDHQMPVCIMHSQGDPKTMQENPTYSDVLLDVYDFLAAQIDKLEQAGLPRRQIIADPGIGFGKTLEHNLKLLNRIGIFHGLGVPILLGVSRKGMIRKIGQAEQAADRVHGSIAVALAAWTQGVQIFRVHDVAETRQAFDLYKAVQVGEWIGT